MVYIQNLKGLENFDNLFKNCQKMSWPTSVDGIKDIIKDGIKKIVKFTFASKIIETTCVHFAKFKILTWKNRE